MPMIGAKKMNGKKSAPQTTETQPVLPPPATPAPDSMYVVAEDDDAAPPATAASESTSSGFRICGISPSRVTYRAARPTPTSVPIVSKKSERKSAKIHTIEDVTAAVPVSPPMLENEWKSKL